MGKTIAIIPARGGSKGIPGKNIININGFPLIYYTLKRAFESTIIDVVVVSSDDDKILEVAKKFYPDVITVKRPKELSLDTSKSIDTILHSLDFLSKENHISWVVMLEPTSPLRKVGMIDEALKLLKTSNSSKALVGVSKVEAQHPSFLCNINVNQQIIPISGSTENIRRQDLKQDYYFYEGSIYASEMKSLLQTKNFYRKDTIGFVIDKIGAIEIDDIEDLQLVSCLISKYF